MLADQKKIGGPIAVLDVSDWALRLMGQSRFAFAFEIRQAIFHLYSGWRRT
jgi:hypothetical protein